MQKEKPQETTLKSADNTSASTKADKDYTEMQNIPRDWKKFSSMNCYMLISSTHNLNVNGVIKKVQATDD